MGDASERRDFPTVQPAEPELAARLFVWARESLGGGLEVASRALKLLDSDLGVFFVVAPSDAPLADRDPRASAGLLQDTADAALLPFVLALHDARTVLVEDELGLRADFRLGSELGDGSRWANVAFVGEHVVWWGEVDGRAVELMRFGSSGYPRTAFVLSETPDALRLRDREALEEQTIESIVDSISAVVVGIYDDESYCIWKRG
jgi:hypothetical protein